MPIITDAMGQRLAFGAAQSYAGLTVLPIGSDWPAGPDYITLGEALAAGTLAITEVSSGGSVPELAVTHTGTVPVLLLDGEELAGAKQNRVLNTTILLREQSRTVIPVSCVEHGRWHYATPEFGASGNVMAASLRARKQRAVSANLAGSGRRDSDQGDVWDGVAEMAARFQVASATGAMRDVYDRVEPDLAERLRPFAPAPDQRGFAVGIRGHLVGVEYLSQPRCFGLVFRNLLRSYGLDALRPEGGVGPGLDPEQVRAFILAALGDGVQSYSALGYGREHRVAGNGVQGSALTVDDALIHLSLLATAPPIQELPFERSYWVEPGRLLAGCFPGAPRVGEAERKLQGLLNVGIGAVINLMETDETDFGGRPFQAYEPTLQRLAQAQGRRLTCVRLPIADQSVPTRETMGRILDCIDGFLADNVPVYVHCWGGKGRTGTVVGCWLARHGRALGDQALRQVQHLRRNDPKAHEPSPENRLQCDMVKKWQAAT